jgi:predicted TIM-barrel fold metal-dependent hydrolase
MIIDCHVHADNRKKVHDLLKKMEDNRIDASVILYFPLWKKKGYLSLEKLIPVVAEHPNLYLAGSIKMIDNNDFDKDFAILQSAAQNKDILAVKLYPGYEQFYPTDIKCERIYNLCTENHIPVIFHSGDTWWVLRTPKVRYADPIYIDDVAVNFPELKILIAHLGNPWIRETAEVMSKNGNVFTDLSGILFPPSHQRRFEKRYTEKLKENLLDLVAYYGDTDKLLFGTDYPLYKQKRYIDFFNSIKEFNKSDRENILFKNAMKFFGIEADKINDSI